MCRSLPQILVVVTRTMASVGASIVGTGMLSTVTLQGSRYTTALITNPFDASPNRLALAGRSARPSTTGTHVSWTRRLMVPGPEAGNGPRPRAVRKWSKVCRLVVLQAPDDAQRLRSSPRGLLASNGTDLFMRSATRRRGRLRRRRPRMRLLRLGVDVPGPCGLRLLAVSRRSFVLLVIPGALLGLYSSGSLVLLRWMPVRALDFRGMGLNHSRLSCPTP